ncbi:tol-pal system YbgF family protein [Geobacter sp. DSM 9736]|uniref:tetratricopeptide repeat protein n=1 Tax=Geobacter sp. DSM 9736 TaxID=1277350 RepID=UPI000B500574|nr:tetratricopeptide repeat protein [Geobacter sp. DSM 9736]SNB47301.1 hypothetical protein SAMN06269301_2779 [Geobacter sp. DSM 9736]
MKKARPIAINIAVISVLIFMLIWGNTWYRQWSQYRKGETALAAGNYVSAIAGFESAIHMYTPGSPFVERSAEKLWELGEMFEKRGDLEGAIVAYRSLRSSFYSTRGIFQPGGEWIARCDGKIEPLARMLKERQRQ